ncbi:MAG: IS21 family transposase [Candidatus Dormibacteraeota bacterium]|uniref:IS21 family transposase n=1 Tax=Candidatus Dormiibacter inghamiae TaxID=3127013 RepID=A0A934KAA3_9BACT|nr:IS21 family transposase [Candidatus Dormibacteraeota bacterium]MBJ7607762.1 IS21 family transposase [Candidatus Dormibacteraeota bacterium]
MEIKALHRLGWSVTDIAREYDLARNTVYEELASPVPRRYERKQPTSLTEAQLIHVERRLAVCPNLRGTDLHAELRHQYGYAGSYPAFQRHLRCLRPAQVRDPEVRFETASGKQTQADWADLGAFPLGREMVRLHAMVTILGYSRAPAIRFATDTTRPTTFERLLRCLEDQGGVTREILTDRDPAFCVGATCDGGAILAPEWVDMATLLGVVPRACKPYRAKTKGKAERMIRELKEGFLGWLSGQLLPPYPSIADYDARARLWIQQMVLVRRHRTIKRIVGEAWLAERALLNPVAERVRSRYASNTVVMPSVVVGAGQRALGEVVQLRDLGEYEEAAR